METALPSIRACVFDAHGTLFDYASAAAGCREALGERLGPLITLWRDKQLQYTWLRALQGRHADFWQVTGDALDFARETPGLDDRPLRARLIDLYLSLDVFPEVPVMLQRLRGAAQDRDPVERLAANARRGSEEGRDRRAPRRCAIGGAGRGLLAAPQGLSARGRSPRDTGRCDLVPVFQCLGCLFRFGLRHAHGVVQLLWLVARTPAGKT
jgi:HAD superfamily hydrolase (TIGR01493 family)